MYLFLPVFQLGVISGSLLLLQVLESAACALQLHFGRTQVVLEALLLGQPQLLFGGEVGLEFGEGVLELLVEGVELAVVGLESLFCLLEAGEGESDGVALLLELLALGSLLFADVLFVFDLVVECLDTVLEVCELGLVVLPFFVEILLHFDLHLLPALNFLLQPVLPAAGLFNFCSEFSFRLFLHQQLSLHSVELGQLDELLLCVC
jgi:hypothetical protein